VDDALEAVFSGSGVEVDAGEFGFLDDSQEDAGQVQRGDGRGGGEGVSLLLYFVASQFHDDGGNVLGVISLSGYQGRSEERGTDHGGDVTRDFPDGNGHRIGGIFPNDAHGVFELRQSSARLASSNAA